MNSVLLGPPTFIASAYPSTLQQRMAKISSPLHRVDSRHFPDGPFPPELNGVECIFSTWGMPRMDPVFLDLCPKLKAVFYAAGSIKGFATPEAFERGIVISSAWRANAIPVADFSVAAITLSLKQFWACTHATRQARTYSRPLPIPGIFRTKVGLVALGVIGRLVAKKLRELTLEVSAYDPFLPPAEAKQLDVHLTGLPEIFSQSDVVSLHTPWLQETENLIGRDLLLSMKHGATFINTSRGAIVNEADLLAVAHERPDLTFLLDVTHPEPPPPESSIYDLPNILLTPHIAGSTGGEIARMGEWMVEEYNRFKNGIPLQHAVSQEMLATMA